jgi:hypothetical protein
MTQDEMYDNIKLQMRTTNFTALESLYNVLQITKTECLPYFKGDKHLYVRADNLPWNSIKTVEFLATANFINVRIVAKSQSFKVGNENIILPIPYLNLYKL